MTQVYAFTSAACNYIPKVRLLIQSLRRHHPEIRVVLALADQLSNPDMLEGEGWDEVLPIESLGIPDWQRWAFTHNIVELSTAIKPFVLSHLLARPDCKAVLYFDPDMVLFSRLDDLIQELDLSDVVLTPHQNKPESGLEQVMDNEICSLKHGIYNLGFIGVRPTPTGQSFAKWWSERVYYFCQDNIPHGLFTDQRWIDLAPALFDGVRILRASRFNVAPWNLTTRLLSGNLEQGFEVDGEPLGFYHFTGFDSNAHHIMAGKYGGRNTSIQALVDWYEQETSRLSEDPLSRQPWAYGRYSDGTPILRAHRLIYRCRHDLQRRYPDPFHADGSDSFAKWCQSAGLREYPELLPEPRPNADWSVVSGQLIPSIAPPPGALPALSKRLRTAIANPQQTRLLAKQAVRIMRRDGVSSFISRIIRLMKTR